MKIDLRKPPKGTKGYNNGEREIWIDGAKWGRTYVESYGPRGTGTIFEDAVGSTIVSAFSPLEKGSKARDLKIYSDRFFAYRGSDSVPLGSHLARVLTAIELAVNDGRFRAPDVARENARMQAAAYTERRGAAQQAENDAFEAKAREALAVLNEEEYKAVFAAVVAAMRWAQDR